MNYNHPQKKNSALATIVVCALVFFVFSFSWLYLFQADVLTVAQHQLSGGKTHYSPVLGALIITVVLSIVQQGVFIVTRLSRRTHALTYFPSMLLLAILSSVGPTFVENKSMGAWAWAIPVLMVVWIVLVWLSKQLLPFDNDGKEPTGLFSQRVWINMIMMVMMMLFVGLTSNTNAVYHYRTHAEVALTKDNTEEALRVGQRSLETDVNLTMLRLYALSTIDAVGDSLFTYTVKGRSSDLLPLKNSHSHLLMLPESKLWKHFGGRWPLSTMTVERYLDSLAVDTTATRAYYDYRLAGQLMDGRLDSFAVTLPKAYTMEADSLPRHYREALVLYQDLKGDSAVAFPKKLEEVSGNKKRQPAVKMEVYRDSVMAERLQQLRSIERKYSSRKTVQLEVHREFRNTYWYYYFFIK